MIEHRGRLTRRLLVPLMAAGTMTGGVVVLTATPASAAMTASACSWKATVDIFGNGNQMKGCSPNTHGDASSLGPSVSGTGISTVDDSNGATGIFDSMATIFSSPYDTSDNLGPSGALQAKKDITSTAGYVSATAQTVGPSPFFTWTTGYAAAWAEPAAPGGSTTHANTGGEQPQTMNGNATQSGTGQVYAHCEAFSNGTETGTVTITNGVVDTHISDTAPTEGYPTESVAIPSSPTKNYRVNFWIENVGDAGYIVFNEQENPQTSAVLTVNAVHMYMMGPTAEGDMIIGQAICGQ